MLVSIKYFKINIYEYLGYLLSLLIFILSYALGFASRETAFFFWFLLIIFHTNNTEYSKLELISFINETYLIYLFLSVLVSFKIISPGLMGIDAPINQFTINLGPLSWNTLIGFSGTTAGIDAYSVLVFLLNFFYKQSRVIVFLSLIAIFLAARFTPLAMIIVPPLVLMVKANRVMLTLFILLVGISFAIPYITSFNSVTDALYFAITSGRSVIWNNYIDLYKTYDLTTILLGYRSNDFPKVVASYWIGLIESPHSSYLRILTTNGIIIYSMFLGFLYKKLKDNINHRKNIFVLTSIIIAGITNENIFYNHNPIYIIIFLYFSKR